jgi:hypothetical protein
MPLSNRASAGQTDVIVTSAARTTTGNSGPLSGWGAVSVIRAQLNVSAASGTTPNLVVLLEDTLDGSTWNTIGTFTAKTTTGREVINVTAPFSDTTRVSWTVTGTTPSFTFDVTAYTE